LHNPEKAGDDLFGDSPEIAPPPPTTEDEDLFQEPAVPARPLMKKEGDPDGGDPAKPILGGLRPGTGRPSRKERLLQAVDRLDERGVGIVLENLGVDELALALLEAGASRQDRMASAMDAEHGEVFRQWLELKDDKIPGGAVDAAQGKLLRVINQLC
jgi:hypothetical protein